MALDVDQLCGASAHERRGDRANCLNGDRPRAWEVRAGRVDVKIPRLRKGSDFREVAEPRRAAEKAAGKAAEKAMTAVIQEACVQGLSTRSPASAGRAAPSSPQRSEPPSIRTPAASRDHWAKLIDAFEPRHSRRADLMRRAEGDVLAYERFSTPTLGENPPQEPTGAVEHRNQTDQRGRRSGIPSDRRPSCPHAPTMPLSRTWSAP